MRYARICPNTNGWSCPSNGSKGGKNSFPGINGFGFEEWLLGCPIIHGGNLNGLRVGFIQAYKGQKESFQDDVTLYYLDSQLNRISAIKINQCRRLTQQEAALIFSQYNTLGNSFISTMKAQIARLNLIFPQNLQPLDIFNVVFNPNSAFLLNPQIPCSNGHTYYTHLYK